MNRIKTLSRSMVWAAAIFIIFTIGSCSSVKQCPSSTVDAYLDTIQYQGKKYATWGWYCVDRPEILQNTEIYSPKQVHYMEVWYRYTREGKLRKLIFVHVSPIKGGYSAGGKIAEITYKEGKDPKFKKYFDYDLNLKFCEQLAQVYRLDPLGKE
jgi:hypothetical protein